MQVNSNKLIQAARIGLMICHFGLIASILLSTVMLIVGDPLGIALSIICGVSFVAGLALCGRVIGEDA